jgi:hypothetical protein
VAIFAKNPHMPHRKRARKEKRSQSALNVIGLNYIIVKQVVLMWNTTMHGAREYSGPF